jgi:hypothetical protein
MITSINKPIDPADATYVVDVQDAYYGFGKELCLDRDELDQYNRDPDLFTARHFGFATADQYREWIVLQGAALCSERTKSGRMCRTRLRDKLKASDWRKQHRSRPCHVHALALGDER